MDAHDTQSPRPRAEYAGAVYGSLLAASVAVGSAVDGTPLPATGLVTVLISTGAVFWLAHVYAHVVAQGTPPTWRWLRAAGRQEWPVAQAALPPAITAALLSGLGMSDTVATWGALAAAVVNQVVWAVAAAVGTRASTGMVVLSGLANLVLGLAVIALKTFVTPH
ncbi:hypothetical protein [Thermoactinospora rubra]|uniref:hypothetical protein n=1 Tax=Thermoactinospora rubra TaxID=1088767 RepID=UPI000A11E1EB|nr:hypothetical protein [Thermoactinospora rubra]